MTWRDDCRPIIAGGLSVRRAQKLSVQNLVSRDPDSVGPGEIL